MSPSHRFPSRVALALLFLTLGLACGGRPMGEECSASDQCEDGGTCLDGVCSGYGCTRDADCENGLVCGEIGGGRVCVAVCGGDEDCLGTQTCHRDDGNEEGACL